MRSTLRLTLGVALVGSMVPVLTPTAAQAAALSAKLVNTIDTGAWAVPSPDPSGITWHPGLGQLIISDSEVDEMPLYQGTNLFLSSLSGVQPADFAGGTTLPWSDEPTGVGLAPASGTLFVSDDDEDLITALKPGPDGRYGTGDDEILSQMPTSLILNDDPEDVAVDVDATNNGTILVADGADKAIYEYSPGPNKVFDGIAPAGDDTVVSFDISQYGAKDPEGLEYHAGRNTILALDWRTNKIYELSRSGALLNTISITAAKPVKVSDLALAPASSGSDQNLYIVDRGIDNNVDPTENDGKIFEMSVVFPPLDGGGGGGGGGGGSTTVQDIAVKSGKDDAEERSSGTTLSGSLQLAVDRSRAQTVGLRFQNVAVPPGATITKAYVQFQTDAVTTGAAALTVTGQAADNAPTFTTAIGDISSRPRTAAEASWSPAPWPTVGDRGADQRTPDLSTVVQEIVNRTGWSKGGAVVVMISGTGTRTAESYNTLRTGAPTLHLEWTV